MQGHLLKDSVLAASASGKREQSPSGSSSDQPRTGKKNKREFVGSVEEAPSASRITGFLKVRDFETLTESGHKDEVISGPSDTRKLSVSPPNKSKFKMVVLDLSEEEAAKLLKLGQPRVVFVSYAFRLRVVILWCFKFLDYGYPRSKCNGANWSTVR